MIQGLTIDIQKDGWSNSRGFFKREIPMPELDEKERPTDALSVIVKVQYAGMCGSDRGMWNRAAFTEMFETGLKREN